MRVAGRPPYLPRQYCGCLSCASLSSCRQLCLSPLASIFIQRALNFLLLPAGHPPIERCAGFRIAVAPSPSNSYARAQPPSSSSPLVGRIARIRAHAPIVVFGVERNISASAYLTYVSKILTGIFSTCQTYHILRAL